MRALHRFAGQRRIVYICIGVATGIAASLVRLLAFCLESLQPTSLPLHSTATSQQNQMRDVSRSRVGMKLVMDPPTRQAPPDVGDVATGGSSHWAECIVEECDMDEGCTNLETWVLHGDNVRLFYMFLRLRGFEPSAPAKNVKDPDESASIMQVQMKSDSGVTATCRERTVDVSLTCAECARLLTGGPYGARGVTVPAYPPQNEVSGCLALSRFLPDPKNAADGSTPDSTGNWDSAAFPPYSIGINYTSTLNPAMPHVFSILRATSEAVSVTFSVVDSQNNFIVSNKKVDLANLGGGGGSSGAQCGCSDQGTTYQGITDYGKTCSDWDNAQCDVFWPGETTGPWCCKKWCYSDSSCPDALPSSLIASSFFSYHACSTAPAASSCSWQAPNPCRCLNRGNFFSDDMLAKFSRNYGSACQAWDINDCEVNYRPDQLDNWCCSNWCYVSDECATAIPSYNDGVELFWSSEACDQDQGVLSQCVYKPSVDLTAVNLEKCKCLNDNAQPPSDLTARGVPSNYGKLCGAHDAYDCQAFNPNVDMGIWCCQSWCWVSPDCPTAQPSANWPGRFFSGTSCEEDEDLLPNCLWSDDCKCQNNNTGLRRADNGKSGYTLPADYGKTCGKWDSQYCLELWGPDAGSFNIWSDFKNDWCCKPWCYVKDSCPVATPSVFGAPPYLYSACDQFEEPQYLAPANDTCVDIPETKIQPEGSLDACTCLGESPPQANRPPGAPADYGSTCMAWDSEKCETYYPDSTRDMWCCLPWCYVSQACPNAIASALWPGHYFSNQYSDYTCNVDTFVDTVRTCGYSEACSCLGKNGNIQSIKPSFPANYGTYCNDWDSVDCYANWGNADPPIWDTQNADGNDWCCKPWCYVSFSCPIASGIASNGMSYSYEAACATNSKTYNGGTSGSPDTCSARLLSEDSTENLTVVSGSAVDSTKSVVSASAVGSTKLPSPKRSRSNNYKLRRRGNVKAANGGSATQSEQSGEAEATTVGAGFKVGSEHVKSLSAGGEQWDPVISGSESWWSCRRRRVAECGAQCCCEDKSSPLCQGGGKLETLSAHGVEDEELEWLMALMPKKPRRGKGGGGYYASPAVTTRRRAPSRPSAAVSSRRRITQRTAAQRRRGPMVSGTPRRRTTTVTGSSGHSGVSSPGPRRRGVPSNYNYGYTSRPALMNNYGGNMPSQTSYGYSGAGAYPAGQRNQIAMGAPTGYRYNSYSSYDNNYYGNNDHYYYGAAGYYTYWSMTRSDYRRRYGRQQWCVVPGNCVSLEPGSMVECHRCSEQCGTTCPSNDDCYRDTGCAYTSQKSLNRDDIMETGFLPQDFQPPLKVTFSAITGPGYAKADVCPSTSNPNPAFKTDLFLTLTQQEFLGDVSVPSPSAPGVETGSCRKNTGFDCENGQCTNDGESCQTLPDPGSGAPSQMCGCKPGFCLEGTAGEMSAVCHKQGAGYAAKQGATFVVTAASLLAMARTFSNS